MTRRRVGWCLIDVVAFVFCVRGTGNGSGQGMFAGIRRGAVATQDPRPWIPEITQ
jgi:hypothetical protein